MAAKLKCPHCGKCVGETISEPDADITIQTNKPIKTKKQKVIIDKVCHRCKNHYYMIIGEQLTAS